MKNTFGFASATAFALAFITLSATVPVMAANSRTLPDGNEVVFEEVKADANLLPILGEAKEIQPE